MVGDKKNDPNDPFSKFDVKKSVKESLRSSFQLTEDFNPAVNSGVWSLTQQEADAQVEDPSWTLLTHFQLLIRLAVQNSPEGIEGVLERAPGLASWKDRKTGLTPLHYAAGAGAMQSIEMLIQYGADLFARDRWGRAPIKLAHDAGQTEIADRLADEMAEKTRSCDGAE